MKPLQIVNEDEHYAMRAQEDLTLDQILDTVWISEGERKEIKA
jgi:hypothetical protein